MPLALFHFFRYSFNQMSEQFVINRQFTASLLATSRISALRRPYLYDRCGTAGQSRAASRTFVAIAARPLQQGRKGISFAFVERIGV
jgi:hypothetical protein